DFPGAIQTTASGINLNGEIVGWYRDASGVDHGFGLRGSTFRTLDFPGSFATYAYGVNDLGDVVGHITVGSAFAYRKGKFASFDYPEGFAPATFAYAINNNGEIAGAVCFFEFTTEGFARFRGIFADFLFPQAIDTYAYGINSAGEIVGDYLDDFL